MGGTDGALQAGSGLTALRSKRVWLGLLLALVCMCARADESDPQKVSLEGTLHRLVKAGPESTGWTVQVDSETVIDGKPIDSIEVSDTHKPEQLVEFENKRVKIAGKVVYRHGMENGTQAYVEISNIKALKPQK